jgi:hypothetical protein
MVAKISEELLTLVEALLRAQLNTIRQLRKAAGLKEREAPREKRMSQMDMVYDILLAAERPMHVDAILAAVKKRFGVQLDKESVVSALAKRVKRHDRFIKTGPNTFSLLTQEVGGGDR